MNLHEALQSIPGNTVLRSHLDNSQATASEILARVRDESGYEVQESKHNYGTVKRVSIVATGYGVLYSEV